MKRILCLILLAMLVLYTAPTAAASEIDNEISVVSDALPEQAREIGGTLTLDGTYDGAGALSRLWDKLLEQVCASLRSCAAPAGALLVLAFVCALCSALCRDEKIASLIQTAAVASAALLLVSGIDSLTGQAEAALQQLNDYSRAALPAVFTAAAATGAVVTSSARYAAVCLALDVLMTVSSRVTLPLIYAFLAVAISGGVFPHPFLKGIGKLLKSLATTVMTFMTTVFTVFLGVTGFVTGSADAVAVKTAKTVLSGVLPVVGGILSDAASAVLAAASLIKNSAGAFALVAVCALCAAPFASLGVKMLLLRAASAAAELTAGERLPALLSDLSSAMGLLLGLVGSFAVMLFFSFLSAIKVSVP